MMSSMSDTERELEALARELGGGWRIEMPTGDPRIAMPILVLAQAEAEALRDRLLKVERLREALSEIADMHPVDSGLRGGDLAREALRLASDEDGQQ